MSEGCPPLEIVTEVFEMGGESIVSSGPSRPPLVPVKIHCASAIQHLQLCSNDTRRKQQAGHDICSTGLRVYDGAAVLGEFFLSELFRHSRLGRYIISHNDDDDEGQDDGGAVLVELGCGCGLAGLCAMAAAGPSSHVIMTDASPSCVALVGKSAAHLSSLLSKDRSTAASGGNTASCAAYSTAVLDWDEPEPFLKQFPRLASAGADIVFGSDLVYFHASPVSLFRIAEQLLRKSVSPSSAKRDGTPVPIILLSHFCRLAQGRQVLIGAAAAAGLVLLQLHLHSFLLPAAILPRGRGDTHFLIACRTGDEDVVKRGMFGAEAKITDFELEEPKLSSEQEEDGAVQFGDLLNDDGEK